MVIRIIRNMLGITFICVIFYFILIHIEEAVIYNMVVPEAGVAIDQWLDDFRLLGLIGLGVAWVSALLWYILAQWCMKVNQSSQAGKRPIWFLCFALPVLTIVVTILLTPRALEGEYIAYIFQFINGTLSYYLSTLWFSPSAFKYTPPMAKVFRRW